jgi:hypothetical protein
MQALLIKFDPGMLARIEHERSISERRTRRRPPRTEMIRELLLESMDFRCRARGEDVPSATAVVIGGDESRS